MVCVYGGAHTGYEDGRQGGKQGQHGDSHAPERPSSLVDVRVNLRKCLFKVSEFSQ